MFLCFFFYKSIMGILNSCFIWVIIPYSFILLFGRTSGLVRVQSHFQHRFSRRALNWPFLLYSANAFLRRKIMGGFICLIPILVSRFPTMWKHEANEKYRLDMSIFFYFVGPKFRLAFFPVKCIFHHYFVLCDRQ